MAVPRGKVFEISTVIMDVLSIQFSKKCQEITSDFLIYTDEGKKRQKRVRFRKCWYSWTIPYRTLV